MKYAPPPNPPLRHYSSNERQQSYHHSWVNRTAVAAMAGSVMLLAGYAVSMRLEENTREQSTAALRTPPPAAQMIAADSAANTPPPVKADSMSLRYLSMNPSLHDIADKMQLTPDMKKELFVKDPAIRRKLREGVNFGYRIGDPEYNWELVQRQQPYTIAEARMRLGVSLFAAFLGITPRTVPTKDEQDSIIAQELPKVTAIARAQGMKDDMLYAAVVLHESGMDRRRISRTGAMGGPMLTSQNYANGHYDSKSNSYIPNPHPSLKPVNPFTDSAHVSGAKILKAATDRYPIELALVAYNQGGAVVDSARDVVNATTLLRQYFGGNEDSVKAHFPDGKNKTEQAKDIYRKEDGRAPPTPKATTTEILNAQDPVTGDYIIPEEGRNFPRLIKAARDSLETFVRKSFTRSLLAQNK